MKRIVYIAAVVLAASCGTEAEFDAQGTFEATEVVVSSEAMGRILNFEVEEGMAVEANQMVGAIDSVQLHLQRKQLVAQQSALLGSRPDVKKQVAALREQIAKQNEELRRVENMLKDGAATQKQRDDIKAQFWRDNSMQRSQRSTRIPRPLTTTRPLWRRRLPPLTTASQSAALSRPSVVPCWLSMPRRASWQRWASL